MRTRAVNCLGGHPVSEIGLAIGPLLARAELARDEATLKAIVHRALDRGVTLFDMADADGNGYAEELLGRLFLGMRWRVTLVTKGGCDFTGSTSPLRAMFQGRQRPAPPGLVTGGENGRLPGDFRPASLRRACEASLQRLQTDAIDLYLLDAPPRAAIESDPVGETLLALRAEGKIRAFGASFEAGSGSPWEADARSAMQHPGYGLLAFPMGLPGAEPGATLAREAARVQPAGEGTRTGEETPPVPGRLLAVEPGHLARPLPGRSDPGGFGRSPVEHGRSRLESGREAHELGFSQRQASLLFALAQPGVVGALPRLSGGRKDHPGGRAGETLREALAELDEALAVGELPPLSGVELERLRPG